MRPTKSDSFLSGNDGWRLNLRFHSIRKGQLLLNPLPTSTLKSKGGVHAIRPRPPKPNIFVHQILMRSGQGLGERLPLPFPGAEGGVRGADHKRPTKSDSFLSGNDGWRLNLRFQIKRKGLFRFNPLPTSTLKSRGGVHAIRPRPPNQTSSFTKHSLGRAKGLDSDSLSPSEGQRAG